MTHSLANKLAASRQESQLNAKVAARNRANQTAIDVAPKVLAVLAPFIGQKVMLAAGGLTAKLNAALEPFLQNTVPVSVWITGGYALRLHVKTCVSDERCCSYMETTVYLGDLDGQVLSRLFDFKPDDFKTDYTVADVVAMRAKVKETKEAHDRARSVLEWPAFGQHDAH